MTLTVTNEQQSLKQDFTKYFLETTFDLFNHILLNDIELDDLESIMTTEFLMGLPSDTEFGAM